MSAPPPGPHGSPAALVAAGFVVSFVLIGGGIDTVGVFIHAIAESHAWPRSLLSLAVSVGAISAALATPPVGAAIDRFGVRVPMGAGLILLALGFGILVLMQGPWQFVVANAFLGPGFAACALLPITVAITICVRERTAFALGVAGAGSSTGALVLAPAVQALIEALGWRSAYVVMGSAVLLAPLPFLAFVLPRGPLPRSAPSPLANAPERPPSLLQELLRPAALPVVAAMVLPGLATFAVAVHLVPYLAGGGLSGRVAAAALGAAIGVSAIGKICGGLAADRIGSVRALRIALLLGTGGLALLVFAANSLLALAAFVLCYGLALGAQIAVMPVLAKQVFGERRFGALFGALQLGALLAAAAGPVAAGILFDVTGHYQYAIALWVLALGLAFLAALVLRVPVVASEPLAEPATP